jgi:hypothetical protein
VLGSDANPAMPAACCCRYWWFTPSGSDERQNIAFAVDGILEGPLLGKAVTIINKAGPEAGQFLCCVLFTTGPTGSYVWP